MNFTRIDDLDDDGNKRVRYVLTSQPSFTFEINSTRFGVQIVGTTPRYTDWVPIQEILSWSQYQAQKLRETGYCIPQNVLDQGTV